MNTVTIIIIAGAAGGGVVLFVLLVILAACCKRKRSRSSTDVTPSSRHEPRRLQRKSDGHEVHQDDQVMQKVTPRQPTDRVSRPPLAQHGSHSRLSSASSTDPIRQHIRQVSYMDSFPEDFAVNGPHAPFNRLSHLSPGVDPVAEYGDTESPSLPPANKRIVEMARQAASQDHSYPARSVSYPTLPVQHRALSHHTSAGSFSVGDYSSPFNSTQPSRMSSDMPSFARHASAGSSSVSSAGRAASVPFAIPGTLSHHPSASSFAFSDGASPLHQAQATRSDMGGFVEHARAGSSSVPSASRSTAAIAGGSTSLGNPFPHQTATVPFTTSSQLGTLSHHPSAGSFLFNSSVAPLNETQAPRMNSYVDDFARYIGAESSTMSPRGQPSTKTAPTPTHSSARIIRHTDMAEDPGAAGAQEVIELPPEYTERPPLVVEPASAPDQKPSRS